jgi:hypothetical protein
VWAQKFLITDYLTLGFDFHFLIQHSFKTTTRTTTINLRVPVSSGELRILRGSPKSFKHRDPVRNFHLLFLLGVIIFIPHYDIPATGHLPILHDLLTCMQIAGTMPMVKRSTTTQLNTEEVRGSSTS